MKINTKIIKIEDKKKILKSEVTPKENIFLHFPYKGNSLKNLCSQDYLYLGETLYGDSDNGGRSKEDEKRFRKLLPDGKWKKNELIIRNYLKELKCDIIKKFHLYNGILPITYINGYIHYLISAKHLHEDYDFKKIKKISKSQMEKMSRREGITIKEVCDNKYKVPGVFEFFEINKRFSTVVCLCPVMYKRIILIEKEKHRKQKKATRRLTAMGRSRHFVF